MTGDDFALRKTVFIPVVSLTCEAERALLELIIEPAGSGTGPQFHTLKSQGLGTAVAMAQKALRVTYLSHLPRLYKRSTVNLTKLGPPLLFLANPMPELSNAEGASFGVTMGLLMYDDHCCCKRVIATGRLTAAVSPADLIRVEPTDRLKDKLAAALTLGYQQQPLPFMVPARTCDGAATVAHCAELIRALAACNICVLAVDTLHEAVTACNTLASGDSK